MSKEEIEEKLISSGIWKDINMSGFDVKEDQEDLKVEVIWFIVCTSGDKICPSTAVG